MSPRHFSNQMFSPYFQSENYLKSDAHKKELDMQDKIVRFVTIPIRVLLTIINFPRRFFKKH